MADSANIVLTTIYDGFKNTIISASLTSDGTGLSAFKIFDASSSSGFGVNVAGQTIYPNTNVCLWDLDYDMENMLVQLLWDATVDQQFLALGAAPQTFNWGWHGGIPCPPGLAGATGSILLTTLNQTPNATLFLKLHIRKGVPQS